MNGRLALNWWAYHQTSMPNAYSLYCTRRWYYYVKYVIEWTFWGLK